MRKQARWPHFLLHFFNDAKFQKKFDSNNSFKGITLNERLIQEKRKGWKGFSFWSKWTLKYNWLK